MANLIIDAICPCCNEKFHLEYNVPEDFDPQDCETTLCLSCTKRSSEIWEKEAEEKFLAYLKRHEEA